MISIIIPIYNAGPYLKECLQSIHQQTYQQYEVLLVDDGSTDDSSTVCQQYAASDSRFHYFHKENGGVSSARNYGIEQARGEWISFIDADDWVRTDYLQTLASQTPPADITFFGATIVNPDSTTKLIQPHPTLVQERTAIEAAICSLRYEALGDIFGWTWNKLFRAEIIRQHNIRFSEEVSFREDELFTLHYCRYVRSLRITDQPLYYYRITPGGLTSKGLQSSDLLPSSLQLEASLNYYSNPSLREHILKSLTDYRAMHIYASPLRQLKANLDDYQQLVLRLPQPGHFCKVNHLTQYLQKSYCLGFLYCLIRKL